MSQHPIPLFSLTNKVALVTGGASGIGAAIAKLLAQAGAHVVIIDIDRDKAEQEVATLTDAGLLATSKIIDLADENSIVLNCAEIFASCGEPWLLVNNAGLQHRQIFLESSAADWDLMSDVNSRGPFLMSREVARAMIAAGQGGRIVNIASASLNGSIVKGLVSYTASKGALLGLSKATAFELAEYGITVNTILPGGVATQGAIDANASGIGGQGPGRRQVPLGMCEGEDIGAAVLYFASVAGRRVTNQVLAIDGGFSVT